MLLTRLREDQRGRHIIADIRYPTKTDSGGDGSGQACLLHTESALLRLYAESVRDREDRSA